MNLKSLSMVIALVALLLPAVGAAQALERLVFEQCRQLDAGADVLAQSRHGSPRRLASGTAAADTLKASASAIAGIRDRIRVRVV